MKYCTHCGAKIDDQAVICVYCGCQTEASRSVQPAKDDTMATLVKVFLILGCVSVGWAIIPLAWCIPITVSIFNKLKTGQPIGTGLKVASLILVSLVAGICLLCMDDN